jgi:hypothetical protein
MLGCAAMLCCDHLVAYTRGGKHARFGTAFTAGLLRIGALAGRAWRTYETILPHQTIRALRAPEGVVAVAAAGAQLARMLIAATHLYTRTRTPFASSARKVMWVVVTVASHELLITVV